MSYRAKLLLGFTLTVILTVGGVAWAVSAATRNSFETMDAERTRALVTQFREEFTRRGAEVVHRVEGISGAEATLTMAMMLSGPQADPSLYVRDASGIAASHKLDFVELVGNDGSVISSAQWPARFGYKNEWVLEPVDWNSTGAFLRAEELPDGTALALEAVRKVPVGEKNVYIVGGQRLDSGFLASLVLTDGMRALLYRNLSAQFQPDQVIDANGQVPNAAKLAGLIEDLQKRVAQDASASQRTFVDTIQWTPDSADAETFHALPLVGRKNDLLGVLLVGSSRAGQVRLESQIRIAALVAGIGGILFGVLLSWWAAGRVTRPVEQLAAAAREVAGGNWSAHVPVRTKDEVGELARSFNQMTAQLTEQRDKLVQTERVAAWRELARRLAHELKNPLFPLQLTVENLQRARAQDLHEFDLHFREGTAALLAEIENLKGIINRFADFARMPAPELRGVDMNQIVRDVIRLYEPQFSAPGRPAITPELLLDDDIDAIQADPELLHRVLSNLVLNALDAMPSGGSLAIRTQRQGTGVFLEVSDSGGGLTREECERLFTPYYTTKKHGTGLGLAIVQSIISDHGGKITVRSEPGQGTTFSIELPERPPFAAPATLTQTDVIVARKPVVAAPPWPEPPPVAIPVAPAAVQRELVLDEFDIPPEKGEEAESVVFELTPEVPQASSEVEEAPAESDSPAPAAVSGEEYATMAFEPPPPNFVAEPEPETENGRPAGEVDGEEAHASKGEDSAPRRGPWGIWRTFTG